MTAGVGQWQPVLKNATLQRSKDSVSRATLTLGGSDVLAKHRHIVLFFGAEWHPLCRQTYTPQLIKVYQHLKEKRGDDVEFIYVSLDRSKEEFERFCGTHPWLSVAYDDVARQALISAFGVVAVAKKLPNLVVLDAQAADTGVVNRDAIPELYLRMNKSSDKQLADDFPWKVSKAGTVCAASTACLMCAIQ